MVVQTDLEVNHGSFYLRKMRQQGGHALQTQEMPGLQRVRQHVQSGGADAAQKE
jgi:hypothetical protein